MQPLLQRKINKYYIFWLCVYSLRYLACNGHAPHRLWPVRFFRIIPHYLINGKIFGKTLLNIKCLFWLYLQYLSETFLLLRIIEKDVIVNVHTSLCKVPVILVSIAWSLNFLNRFSKNTQISNFMKIRPVVAQSFHVDGQTDSFVNAPKNSPFWSIIMIVIKSGNFSIFQWICLSFHLGGRHQIFRYNF